MTGPMMGVMLALAICSLVVGGILLFLALRGRRVNNHPHCRKCRFDLIGLALDGDAARCPECGRVLRDKRFIRLGLRKKRPLLGALGAFLILVPVALVGLAIASAARPNINAYKPDFWLLIEARTASPATIPGQLSELLSRVQAGSLSQPRTATLIERALAVQADMAGGWAVNWGDILDYAAANTLLTPEQLEQYARHSPQWSVSLRQRVLEGTDWVILVSTGPGRVGNAPGGGPPFIFQPSLLEVRAGEHAMKFPEEGGQTGLGISPNGASAMNLRRAVPGLGLGAHEVTTIWKLSVCADYDTPAITTWTEERTSTIEVLPAGTHDVELVMDESLRAAIEKSLKIGRGGITVEPSATPFVSLMIECDNPPIALAFDVVLRERAAVVTDGSPPREWKVGQINYSGNAMHMHGLGADVRSMDVDAVDVVLRPSIDAARGTVGTYKISGLEIVLADIAVTRKVPAPPPPAPEKPAE